MKNPFAYLSDSERRQWLNRTDRELAQARERLAECKREGRSTNGAQISLAALQERKALLTGRSSPYRPYASPSPKTYTAPREIRSMAATREGEDQRMLAKFKARQDRDAWLRRIYGE